MLFKVYAQCCKVVKPIEQVDSITEGLWANIENLLDAGKIGNYDDEQKVDADIAKAWDALTDGFNKTGLLLCGDYQIVKAEHRSNVVRPNKCGWEII